MVIFLFLCLLSVMVKDSKPKSSSQVRKWCCWYQLQVDALSFSSFGLRQTSAVDEKKERNLAKTDENVIGSPISVCYLSENWMIN